MSERCAPGPSEIDTGEVAASPVIVVGAGAAGLMAAIFAARGGAGVTLLETRPKPGAKIRVSGGGRCNVLPSRAELADFHTHGSPHSLRKIFGTWPLADVTEFFERDLGIALKIEATGKVFPQSDDPREIVAALLGACADAGVRLVESCRVTHVRRSADGSFEVEDEGGRRFRGRRLVLATGGKSLPKTGSDGAGLEWARELGHELVPTYPALVPLLSEDAAWAELAGISLPVELTVWSGDKRLATHGGDFLFTHRGFSGPVVLDVSYFLAAPDAEGRTLTAHWCGADWDGALRSGGKGTVVAVLREHLPKRLVYELLRRAAVDPAVRLAVLGREARRQLVRQLTRCPLSVSGNEGYRTAEVTDGGIALQDVRPDSLESRLVPGLFFAGEMLDVTGRIGGFNFLWAWVTGRLVGRALARDVRVG